MAKNYNEISCKHLLRGINLCSKKYSKDFGKEAAIGLEQRCCHSFTRTNITNNGFWKRLESPIQKDGKPWSMNVLGPGTIPWKCGPPNHYLHHGVDERFHLHKESNQKKVWHNNINSSDTNNRVCEDRKSLTSWHCQKNERKFIFTKL